MFEIIFLIVVCLYFLQIVLFSIGVQKKHPRLSENELPTATVIVAARNEEENILQCITSLNLLEYPSGKLDIIIVDDYSTDLTNKIVADFISDKPAFKLIQPVKQFGEVKGKANAIANAIEIASGEIILTTDADCSVSPTWAKTLVSYYKEDVAMVCGYTDQFTPNLFHSIQSLDFIYLLGVAAGAMNLGKPLSAIGNNMSYRKSVYDEIGGYANIPFSVTEDFQMLMTMHKLKKYKIIYPMDPEGKVTSKACENVKSLYWQKKRWGIGGLESDLIAFSVMGWGWLANLGILLTPFFYSAVSIYILFFKILADYFFLTNIYKKLKLKFNLKEFIGFEIYFIVYVILLPIIAVFSKKVKWKEREFIQK